MDGYWLLGEMAKARHEEFLSEARRARWFLSSKRHRQLSALVQSLMLIFG